MSPEIQELRERIQKLEGIIYALAFSDRYVFARDIEMQDGRKIQVATGYGSSFGTGVTQKLSVYGVTPVIQATAISAPTGGATIDAESRTAINSIRTALINFGITA